MPLSTTHKMLNEAQKNGYAVAAFNVENMEMLQGVIMASEKLNVPVIIQTTPSTIKYGGINYYYHNALAAAECSKTEIALHLDHGDSYEIASKAFRQGFTSIMIDGSQLSFEENIQLTKRVVSFAKPSLVPVEAELGKVGGKEDGLDAGEGAYTDPDLAHEFIERTEADSLAVAIGTAHGVYKTTPKLDIERLKKIRQKVAVPLVLHGASGISDDDIRNCVSQGICKINFATELRIVFSRTILQAMEEDREAFDPKIFLDKAREAVMKTAINKITVCRGL